MRPLFLPVAWHLSARSNSDQPQSKAIIKQRLPKIAEETPLTSGKKTRNITEVFFSCFPYCRKLQN
ncbi:MAG TPA: hypothetical protein VGZ69_04585 [Candidatus Rhabdochlamydia sp.]|jgi:hypothetical protein|nr:hypothetical protein [Candidatus Rhabdochlamydia sp.]